MNSNRTALLFATAFAALAAIASPSAASAPAPTLDWRLDDRGTSSRLVAADASGSGLDGMIGGNVRGTGAAFTGFTNPDSGVFVELGDKHPFGKDATLTLRLRNPGAASRTVVAGLGADGRGNRAWEIWFSAPDVAGRRVLNFTYANWNGGVVNFAGDPVRIETGAWHRLTLVWRQVRGRVYSFSLYLAPEAEIPREPVIADVTPGQANGPGPATGSLFYIGGRDRGWFAVEEPPARTGSFPGGYFGRGEIADVRLWLGAALTPDRLPRTSR